jgi:pimeloyl-ACP methyl ester carboxylesterase
LLLVLTLAASSVWFVHETSQPLNSVYLVTPEKYGMLSSRGAQVTDEKWGNLDGTGARGWLLRGTPGAPAVILLHRYGADRSHVLNLGVKLNEATNYTILMPDMRGHGENPLVPHTSFGGCESDDVASSIAYLRSLKSPEQMPIVGKYIGLYGLEMGALAALSASVADPGIKAMVLDSVPLDSDGLLASIVRQKYPFASEVTSKVAGLGTYPYYYQGCYKREPACEIAKTVANKRILLLGGLDAPALQESTGKLAKCFPPTTTVDSKTDLSPSGFSMIAASIEQSEAYDQRIIDYLKYALQD